jgi:hypothetical protein
MVTRQNLPSLLCSLPGVCSERHKGSVLGPDRQRSHRVPARVLCEQRPLLQYVPSPGYRMNRGLCSKMLPEPHNNAKILFSFLVQTAQRSTTPPRLCARMPLTVRPRHVRPDSMWPREEHVHVWNQGQTSVHGTSTRCLSARGRFCVAHHNASMSAHRYKSLPPCKRVSRFSRPQNVRPSPWPSPSRARTAH